jgi:hypothetical protein
MKIAARSHPILSPFGGKPILPGFDGAGISFDAGPTPLRTIERKAGPAGRLAACMADPRDPAKVRHSLDDIIRLSPLMIAAGFEDGLDADSLRHDPGFKIALEHAPETGTARCSQPTISRREDLPDQTCADRDFQADGPVLPPRICARTGSGRARY